MGSIVAQLCDDMKLYSIKMTLMNLGGVSDLDVG